MKAEAFPISRWMSPVVVTTVKVKASKIENVIAVSKEKLKPSSADAGFPSS